jgi:hypothetical protein
MQHLYYTVRLLLISEGWFIRVNFTQKCFLKITNLKSNDSFQPYVEITDLKKNFDTSTHFCVY